MKRNECEGEVLSTGLDKLRFSLGHQSTLCPADHWIYEKRKEKYIFSNSYNHGLIQRQNVEKERKLKNINIWWVGLVSGKAQKRKWGNSDKVLKES